MLKCKDEITKKREVRQVSEAYTETRRFRCEGRSGRGTYERLFSEKYNVPPQRLKAEKKSPEDGAKRKLFEGRRLAQPGFFAAKLNALREKIPAPVKNIWHKLCSAARSFAKRLAEWKYLKPCLRITAACAAIFTCLFGLVYAIGCSALDRSGVFDSLSVRYSDFSRFSPNGQINESQLEDRGIIVVSSADMSTFIKKEKSSRIKTALHAGLNELSVLGLDLRLYCRAEAGIGSISPEVFGKNGNRDIEFVIKPTAEQLCTVGCHTLRVRTAGRERNVLLIVEDTVVPQVKLRDVEIMLGEKVGADMFIESTTDPSALVVSFLNGEPDFALSGQQLVYLNIMDSSGNACELLAARLTVTADVEPPVIIGAKDRTVIIGESVAYKDGITVTDNLDENVTLKVDTSAVDPSEEGYYDVTYTASDSSGNASSVTVTFHFAHQDAVDTDEQFDRYVKKISSNIFKDSMTDTERLWAIYEWCRNNIGYSGHSDKGDWKKAAVSGFKNRSGDCYTYFACAKALIEYCGIENKDVIKIKDTTDQSSHFWSLVNIGTGYYHFDATPRKGGFDGFMLTDRQLQDYSLNNSGSHRYHTNLYPATPTERFSAPGQEEEQ